MSSIELTKINLRPGEVLVVNLKSDETNTNVVTAIRNSFQSMFPQNKVVVFAMGLNDEVNFTTALDTGNVDLKETSCGNGGCGHCETPCQPVNADETP